jgi:hypothetical protein
MSVLRVGVARFVTLWLLRLTESVGTAILFKVVVLE